MYAGNRETPGMLFQSEIITLEARGWQSDAITVPKAPKLSAYRAADGGMAGTGASVAAKKRANRNKSLDISEATRRESRRAARGDRNEGGEAERERKRERKRETGTATETQELFLFTSELISSGYCIWISERSDGTQRGEPRRMRESVEHTALQL